MRVRFSRHAKNKMRLYGILAADVEWVATRPSKIAVDERGNLCLTRLDGTGRAIIAVIASDDPDFVITTFPED
jgi:hypothetical protein